MLANTDFTKSPHCQQQAIYTLKTIFPSLNLPQFGKDSSVWYVLEKSAKNLPRPRLSDITLTIENMKQVVDNQQLKIQKNMLEIQRYQQIIMRTTNQFTHPDEFQQSLKIRQQKSSNSGIQEQSINYYQVEQEMNDQRNRDHIDDLENAQIEKNKNYIDDIFSYSSQIDYLYPSNVGENSYQEEEDVRKYLSLGF